MNNNNNGLLRSRNENAILIQKILALIRTVVKSQIWHPPQIFSGAYDVIITI